jgi:uncharacterized protein
MLAPLVTSPAIARPRYRSSSLIEGYASLFNREDLTHDIIVRGAFKETLRARGARGIKLLMHHDPKRPIGVWDEISEDRHGLHVRGYLIDEVRDAKDVRALLSAGALDGLSIGFRPLRSGRSGPQKSSRVIFNLDLLEISLVTFPMMPGARATLLA